MRRFLCFLICIFVLSSVAFADDGEVIRGSGSAMQELMNLSQEEIEYEDSDVVDDVPSLDPEPEPSYEDTSVVLDRALFDSDRSYYFYLHSIGQVSDEELYRWMEVNDSVDFEDSPLVGSIGNLDGLDLEDMASGEVLGGTSSASLLLASPVPSSGSAYSNPSVVSVDYAPSPDDGSLTSILYDLIGTPVQAIHYKWRTNGTNAQDVYGVQQLDYDPYWLGSLAVFIVVLWSIFRLGACIWKK